MTECECYPLHFGPQLIEVSAFNPNSWTPDIPTYAGTYLPEHWYRSDQGLWQDAGVTPAALDGAVVGRWEDLAANADHANQANAGNKPTLQNGVGDLLNGYPVVRFDGVDDGLTGTYTTGGALSQPFTVFAVAKLDTVAVDDGTLRYIIDSDDAVNRCIVGNQTTTTPDTWRIYAGASLEGNATDDDWHIFTALFNGASSEFWRDGASKASGNVGAQNADGITIGNRETLVSPWYGDIAEIIIYDAELSVADRAQVGGYLSRRYGLDYAEVGALADGAWCWFSDPRAVYYNGKTYIGSISSEGDIQIAEYNHATATWSPPFLLHAGLQIDDHNNPSILVRDSDRRLLVFYTKHNDTDMRLRISTNPEDATAFAAEVNLDAQLGIFGYCYTIPIQLTGEINDPIYLFFRRNAIPTYDWWYGKSVDGGATWAAAAQLWSIVGERPYMKAVQNGDGRIDFVVSNGIPVGASVSLYHFYYIGGSWYTSAGVDMGAPPFGPGDATLVYDGTAVSGWQQDIAIDGGGSPVIAYATFPTPASDHRYHVARWTGAAWISDQVCTAGGPLPPSDYYSGGLFLNHADTNTCYASREVSGQHELFRYTYAGGVWSLAETLTSGSAYPNYRPMVPYSAADPVNVLWVYGRYTTYTDYDTAILYD